MTPLLQSVAAITACLIALLIVKGILDRFSRLPLPPGPPKLPLIGNLLQLPSSNEHKVYQSWGEQYDVTRAGVIHVDAAGTSIVILNNAKAAWDLLEKRSIIYSGRPSAPMATDLMGWNWAFGMQTYGESWRIHRRVFSQAMNINAAKMFRHKQIKATHFLLSQLLEKPEVYFELIYYHSARIIMSIAYGIDVKTANDPWVGIAEDAVNSLANALIPGAFLVDSLPFLRYVPSWMPGAGFKRKARKWKEFATRLVNAPFAAAKQIMESGEHASSFVSESLWRLEDDMPRRQEQEDLIRETAGTMYLAGADTTTAAIASFLFAMLVAPDVQRKAQEEVDRVTPGRLPTFEDERSMPYVTAVVYECLRWNNVTPLGIPHYSTAEDVYNGYRIPIGSIVVGNTWAILHDENMYPEPYEFKPERYFKPGTNEFDETVQPPMFAAFGFGRRICPGRHLAYASLWIAVTSFLKTFHISKATDDHGNIIEPVYEPQSSVVATPSPFRCSIKPRSAEAEKLISAAND